MYIICASNHNFTHLYFCCTLQLSRKLVEANLPRVSSEFVDSITAKYTPRVYSDEIARESDELLKRLSMLCLAVERAQNEYKETAKNEIAGAIAAMKSDIASLENDLLDSGAILLTPSQVETMLAGVNMNLSEENVKGKDDVYCPPDTANTRYYLYGPYTMSTSEGNCTYYYINATALSTKSNM